METIDIVTCIENGSVTYVDKEDSVGDIGWNPHPKFQRVYMKHVVRGAHTEGMLSCHLVKIDPNAVLEEHVHEGQWELHEVIEGDGTFFLDTKETLYYPGCMAIIPKGAKHKVVAGSSGMVLLAKFFPALL